MATIPTVPPRPSVTRGLLQRLALVARHHYRWVFAVFLVLVVVAAALASRLRFDTDILNLLPRKDPVIRAYLETLEEFGTFDYLLVVTEIPEGAPVDPYEMYADALARRLGELPHFESVEHRIGEMEELLEELFPQAVLFLDTEGRQELGARLTDQGIRRRVQEVRRQLSTPQSLMLRELVRLDPLGAAEIFIHRIESGQGSLAVDWASGYYLSQDQRLLLILAKPVRPPQDIAFDEAMVADVEAAVAATTGEWEEIAGPEPPPAPRVRTGGAYVTAMEDARLIQGDMIVNMATSMGLVLALFLFAFRRAGTLGYAFVPLVVGLVLTFGFSALAFGVLSSATSGTAALLIGLGIDFVIVSYGRYVEERQRGQELEGALMVMMGSSGRAVVVGAVTTAATFYAFTFTDFRGLRQMGILTGTGILFCMAAVLWLLPAMLSWSEDRHQRRERSPNLYLHSFGTGRLVRLSMRHPWPVLVTGGLITVVAAAAAAAGLSFQDNWRAMRPAGSQGVAVEKEVARHFKSDFDFMMLVLAGEDLDALMERTDEATRRAQQLVEQGVLTGVSSVTSVLPPPARQQEALAWLAEGRREGKLDPARIREVFAREARAEGLSPAYFDRGLDLLAQALSPTEPLSLADLPETGQAQRLLERVIHRRGEGWKSVIYLYPPAEVWRRQAPPEVAELAAELGPDVILTGANVVNENMRQRVWTDAWIAGVLGTVVVFLLLWLDFRRFPAAVCALTPLGVGIFWMLGGMGVLEIPMNFMNIFVTTMIIGIGVDYGLHMVHRYREVRTTPGADLVAGLVETGNAIVIAALSTVVGFGSLSLSHFPGLRSTGLAAILGALATALVAVTLLPAYLSLRVAGHRRRQGGGEEPPAR